MSFLIFHLDLQKASLETIINLSPYSYPYKRHSPAPRVSSQTDISHSTPSSLSVLTQSGVLLGAVLIRVLKEVISIPGVCPLGASSTLSWLWQTSVSRFVQVAFICFLVYKKRWLARFGPLIHFAKPCCRQVCRCVYVCLGVGDVISFRVLVFERFVLGFLGFGRVGCFLVLVLGVCLFCFQGRISLHSYNCPKTHYIEQAGLTYRCSCP